MVFGVAMNSRKNTLVALLIAANFTEIKGARALALARQARDGVWGGLHCAQAVVPGAGRFTGHPWPQATARAHSTWPPLAA